MTFWKSSKDRDCRGLEATRALLVECCESKKPAKVLLDDNVIEVRFLSIGESDVRLALRQPADATIVPLGDCFVTFVISKRTCAFVGRILDFTNPWLVVQLPNHIALTEQRSAVRVPVVPESDLAVRVTTESEKTLEARAIDVSFTGALIELVDIEPTGLRVGSTVELELRHGDNVLRIESVVRRRADKNRYGVVFPKSVSSAGETKPPHYLRELIDELEDVAERCRTSSE